MTALTLVTAPAIEPITIDEAKAHLRVDLTYDDPYIAAIIRVAREMVETWTGRALITQTWDLSLDGFPYCGHIELPLAPLQSITSLTTYDTASAASVWAASNYLADTAREPGRLVLGYGQLWPYSTLQVVNGVRLRFVAGYGDGAGDVPESIRHAMLLLIGHLYEHREGASGTAGQGALAVIPMGVAALLATYNVKGY